MTEIQKDLLAMQDLKNKDFQCKLIPTVDPETVIGIRTPLMRQYAKELASKPEAAAAFLSELPHKYYDENNLHGFLIERIKDYTACVAALDTFLPYVDNWATCDLMSPKIFKKHIPELLVDVDRWINSGKTYTIRFGVEMLMSFCLDDNFKPVLLDKVAAIKSEEYYVRMMVAWFFATALAKQYDATLPYIENKTLEKWTHNKTIRKAIESYRITDEQKAYLRTLSVK